MSEGDGDSRRGGLGLASAFRTLTILRVPGRDSRRQATMLFWFPLVGAVLGGLAWLLAYAVSFSSSVGAPIVGGSLVVGSLAWLTRAFHLDGLADMADGFGGGWTKDRILEIMKDSRMGAFGTVALVIVLLIKTASCVALFYSDEFFVPSLWFVVVPACSRMLLAVQTAVNRYARQTAGTAGILVGESRWYHGAVSAVVTVVCIVLAIPEPLLMKFSLVLCGGVFATASIGLKSRRKIGGVTGDVLGATCELSETAMFALAALL